MKDEFLNEELKNEITTYIKENGFDVLINNATLKVDLLPINFTIKIHSFYNKTNGFEKRDLREFWDCFPYYFWNRYYLQNNYWKVLFEHYLLEFEFESLRKNTIFKNKQIGLKLYKLRKKYTKSTFKQQKKMINFWSCIPLNFWNEKDDKFKKLFSQFIINNGFEKLSYNIYKNSNSRLGLKAYKIHKKYKLNKYFKQMELKKYWDCFPDEFWSNRYLRNIGWKRIFRDFFKEHELYELTICTIYKNKYIGRKADFLIKHYSISMSHERSLIRNFWSCFPKEFWINKQLLSEKKILKNNFFIIKDKKAFYNSFSKMQNSYKSNIIQG